jgi:aminomethyltransferase
VSKRSPVHDRHEAAGAKFSEFGGWSMPLEYAGAGVLAEHAAVRSSVGLFDVSHLGKIVVSGSGAADFVNRCLTADLRKIAPGQAQYTLICNDDGGVVDDLIAYLRTPGDVLLIPNAANCAEVVDRLTEAAPAQVRIEDRHDAYAVFAVQGPHSDEVLETVGLPAGHGYMSFARAELSGVPLTICRTGYTGERGYELVVPSEQAGVVWDAVVAAGEAYGIQLAGLGARDTLRTEMGYPLHGQDISPDISPVQARLGWAVGWKKDAFFGDAALRAEKEATPNRLLWGLRAVGRGIPRPGMLVRDADGHEIGSVTSGTFSPTLKTGIALALLDSRFVVGEEVEVDVRTRREAFTITKPPFVTPGVREP